MARREGKWRVKELGLEAGYRYLKFTLGTEFLHYGLFEPDIPVKFENLKAAQERYTQRLIEAIPAGTQTILDVGCGSGAMAHRLIQQGYCVDCVAPGEALTAIAAERLGGLATIYRGRFETLEIPARYDLVLFSESLQYIAPEVALGKSLALLKPSGHLLICDFFSDKTKGKSPMGGGHPYDSWCETLSRHPIDIVLEREITAETAPTHDIARSFMREVARPVWESSMVTAAKNWPLATRFGRWLFRKQIRRFEQDQLPVEISGAVFRHFKIYKTYLLRAQPQAAAADHATEAAVIE